MTTTMTTTHSSYENNNPFLLPEMLHLLYPLLSTEDLLKAITICKYWNIFFIPRIWQTLNVGANHRGRAHIHTLDHLDGLEKNIHFVRHLDIAIKGSSTIPRVSGSEAEQAEERLKVILVQCRGLTQLNTDSVYEELFEVLANNRGSIVSFKLNSAADDQDMLRLWHVLGDDTDARCMGNLKHLALKRIEIPGDGGDPAHHLAFVKLCRRLETLDCYGCPMRNWTAPVLPIHTEGENENNGDDTHRMPWALKQVKLTNVLDMISVDVPFLKRCTCLEQLTWSSLLDQRLHPDFLQFLIQSRLKFLSVNGLFLPDESLARLIEHLPSTIAELRFNTRGQSVNMGPRSVAAAAAVTSPSLSLISIAPGTSKLTSAVTQQLLSSCNSIVRLDDALTVDAVDLLTAPWVMSRLVKLELTINNVAGLRTASSNHTGSGSNQNGRFDRTIYGQLSKLVSLEDLVLIETSSIGTKNSWIKFTLSHGMGELGTLVHLRRLDIGRLQGLKMGADEGRWICQHWPALENLVVVPQKDVIPYKRLISYLRRNRPGLKIDGDYEETL
ncbi:hypothetical protein B0O80DRAFT_499251 [Mortierella sp. GBAus27b]|nr:hypothetical protein B0O80DRAFT_499251 [Mortierella sp. GBAus27b]